MDSPTVVTLNAHTRGCRSRRPRRTAMPPAAAGASANPGATVAAIGDPQAIAFAREIERLERQLAALSTKPLDADEAARRRLARELHDHVGAELAATRFALANVRSWLPADAPPQCEDALALVQRSLDAVCSATRDVLAGLNAPSLDGGLVRSLSGWIRDFGARTGLRTSFVCAADLRLAHLSADAALAVFRVTQEALANVARHAQASGADVRLVSTARTLTLTVVDDGIGVPSGVRRRAGHYGIAGMRTRCEAFGGSLRIASARPCAHDAVTSAPSFGAAVAPPRSAAVGVQSPPATAVAPPQPVTPIASPQPATTGTDASGRRGTTVRARFAWDALLRPADGAQPLPTRQPS